MLSYISWKFAVGNKGRDGLFFTKSVEMMNFVSLFPWLSIIIVVA